MIRSIYTLLVSSILCSGVYAQTFRKVTDLSSRIEETSGLLYINGHLLTHNDSGGSVKLYEIDTLTGEVTNDVLLNGATLTDWEDMCADDSHIYIGDFGNNVGERVNLKLYKVLISDYFDGDQSAEAEIIEFEYSDQLDFTPAQFQTNFDAETLIAYGDHLLVFTKNWGDGNTRVYPLSKDGASEQSISPVATLDVGGLVTAGVYDPVRQVIMLTGYENFFPFIIELKVDGTLNFDQFSWTRSGLETNGGSTQIEGISLSGIDSSYYISAERTTFSDPTLYQYILANTSSTVAIRKKPFKVYPNPTSGLIFIDGEQLNRVELYDSSGKLVRHSSDNRINVASLPRGTYNLKAITSSGQVQSNAVVLE